MIFVIFTAYLLIALAISILIVDATIEIGMEFFDDVYNSIKTGLLWPFLLLGLLVATVSKLLKRKNKCQN